MSGKKGKSTMTKIADPGKKAANPSEAQKTFLIEYVTKNPELLSGKFTSVVTRETMDQKWDLAAVYLNMMPMGAVKEKKQWKRTFQDQKKKVMNKAAHNRRSLSKTGGGQSELIPLTPEEERLLALIPKIKTDGDEVVTESDVLFECDGNFNLDLQGVEVEDFADDSPIIGATINVGKLDFSSLQRENIKLLNLNIIEKVTDDEDIKETLPEENENKENIAEAERKLKNETLPEKNENEENLSESRAKVKTETLAFPPKKKNLAIRRQDATIRNSENLLTISENELDVRKRYYDGRLQLEEHRIRTQWQTQRRDRKEMGNKLTYPW